MTRADRFVPAPEAVETLRLLASRIERERMVFVSPILDRVRSTGRGLCRQDGAAEGEESLMNEPPPGGYFEANGLVFQRSLRGAEQDFGGVVGRCLRSTRLGLDEYERAFAVEQDWVPVKAVHRLFGDEREAEVALILAQERNA